MSSFSLAICCVGFVLAASTQTQSSKPDAAKLQAYYEEKIANFQQKLAEVGGGTGGTYEGKEVYANKAQEDDAIQNAARAALAPTVVLGSEGSVGVPVAAPIAAPVAAPATAELAAVAAPSENLEPLSENDALNKQVADMEAQLAATQNELDEIAGTAKVQQAPAAPVQAAPGTAPVQAAAAAPVSTLGGATWVDNRPVWDAEIEREHDLYRDIAKPGRYQTNSGASVADLVKQAMDLAPPGESSMETHEGGRQRWR